MASDISVRTLRAGYGRTHVLNDINLEVGDGETIALLGTNGNGKSTLMKCIMGAVRPMHGSIEIRIDGVTLDCATLTTEQLVQHGVSLVPEGRHLFPKLSVLKNLMLGAYRDAARASINQSLEEVFDIFPILKERSTQAAGSMSGGEQQMLALGRALMARPKVLLVDEPSVGLAPIFVTKVMDQILELKRRANLTILIAEQNFPEAMRVADRGYVIVHGEIAGQGTREELSSSDVVKKFYFGE